MRATQPNKARLTKASELRNNRETELQLTPLLKKPQHSTHHQLRRRQPLRAPKENYVMYTALIATVFALAVFTPSFIGIRARTNANWRSL
jgi:hypothetical protein